MSEPSPGRAEFDFDATLWEWDGPSSWHFVSLPEELSELIADSFRPAGPGFGSIRVEVVSGPVTWRTSIFPDAGRGAYVLPVKAEVRRRLGAVVGDRLTVTLRVL